MESFEGLLNESVKAHGHLCPGQVVGVRLAMLGLDLIGIDDPKGKDKKSVYVFVEINRCATEAIQSVSGCSLKERNYSLVDVGVMAATFVNRKTNIAYRIISKEESRELAEKYFPEILNKRQQQLEAYKVMPNDEMFTVQKVSVDMIQENSELQNYSEVKCSSHDGKSYYNIIK